MCPKLLRLFGQKFQNNVKQFIHKLSLSRNSTVEDFYKYSMNSSTSTSGIGYYYLNNFANLFVSGVTLFELTVVNNWFIIMDAYASVTNTYSRMYFMLFYLFTMVVLTIVVASVLEAFRFRIQYKKQTSKRDGKYRYSLWGCP